MKKISLLALLLSFTLFTQLQANVKYMVEDLHPDTSLEDVKKTLQEKGYNLEIVREVVKFYNGKKYENIVVGINMNAFNMQVAKVK
ncbi:hypothetical protein SMGD1_0679 [Sulfurimonas gotlandica GD1]|uniref:PepSY domain-containing protein n=1 Tax=Sulfurimonas gotlandica (strain DSM 19862 / JCM 16533 / GD1) TaxID=929558 RepID=B6BKZ2_SULGG|nr:hypothetical protein [Sulfurimonas gotlandica]EDZ62463.1 hypothetical protein CBGD1_379 [Sulfurimonas gotlandica GD1]EHP29206.1 hypothetical protein SMGD1_0679 [Sulfurimonas gotlandica GD1]